MRRSRRRLEDQSTPEHYWPSFTDMMSMVVLVFLFITIIAFIKSIVDANNQVEIKKQLTQATQVKQQISNIIDKKIANQVGRDKITRGPNNTISIQGDVLFDSASSKISPKGQQVLNKVADALVSIINDPKLSPYIYNIQIEGHTDSVPYDNWTLSSNRALSVLKYLQKANAKLATDNYAKYLAVVGYSKYKPAVTGTTATDRAKNRRISFQIILDDNKWQKHINNILNGKG